jgi:hypothetical protein
VPVAAQLKTHPVELDLDGPAVAVGQRLGTRQHRVDETGKLLTRGHTARVSETASRDRIDSLVTLPMRVSIADAAPAPRVSVYESRFLPEAV